MSSSSPHHIPTQPLLQRTSHPTEPPDYGSCSTNSTSSSSAASSSSRTLHRRSPRPPNSTHLTHPVANEQQVMGVDSKDDFKTTTTDSSLVAEPPHHPVHLTRDDARLEDLGYRPELKRNFSKLETFGGKCEIRSVWCRRPAIAGPGNHEASTRRPHAHHPCSGWSH